MALITQSGAVTGRRRPHSYLDIINTQAPYLPYYKQAEAEQENWRKTHDLDKERLGLERRRLAEETDLSNRRLAMTAQHYRDLEKQGKKAATMGWANVGLGAGLGLADLLSSPELPVLPGNVPDVTEKISSGLYDVATDPGGGFRVSDIPLPEGGTKFDIPYVPEFIERPLEWMYDFGSDIYEGAIDIFKDIIPW